MRAWLIDALALGMDGLAVFHYKPDGLVAGLIVFAGAYTIISSLLQGLPRRASDQAHVRAAVEI